MPNPSNRLSIHLDAAEILQHGVMFLDRDANVLFVNRHFAQGLGYSSDEFQPKTFFQVNPHLNLMAWKKLWEELLESGQMTVDTEHITATGDTVPAKLRGVLLEVDGQKYCQAIVEGDLTKSQEDLFLARFCLDNVNEMIAWVSPEGLVFYANKAMREVLGYTSEELSNLNITDLEPGFTKDDWEREWKEVKSKGSLMRETVRRTKSGEEFPVELSLHYMNYNGREYKMAFVRDIRKLRARDETILLSTRALDEASQMIYWLLPDASFCYVNNATCEKLGYERGELLRLKMYEGVEPGLTKKTWEARWERLKAEKRMEFDTVRLTKSGEEIPVRLYLNYMRLGSKAYNLAFATDLRGELQQRLELRDQLKEIGRLKEQLAMENVILKEEIQLEQGFNNIISRSPKYKPVPVSPKIKTVADVPATWPIWRSTGSLAIRPWPPSASERRRRSRRECADWWRPASPMVGFPTRSSSTRQSAGAGRKTR